MHLFGQNYQRHLTIENKKKLDFDQDDKEIVSVKLSFQSYK